MRGDSLLGEIDDNHCLNFLLINKEYTPWTILAMLGKNQSQKCIHRTLLAKENKAKLQNQNTVEVQNRTGPAFHGHQPYV